MRPKKVSSVMLACCLAVCLAWCAWTFVEVPYREAARLTSEAYSMSTMTGEDVEEVRVKGGTLMEWTFMRVFGWAFVLIQAPVSLYYAVKDEE